MGLPANWQPLQYLGAGNQNSNYCVKTPKGIQVFSLGFEQDKYPEMKGKIQARVNLEDIDTVWKTVRDRLANGADKRLTKGQMNKIAKLKDNYPLVHIMPSIWWDNGNNCYVAGLTTDMDEVEVVVWYKTVLPPIEEKNWKALLDWEFQNVCFWSVGRKDLAS